jgi:PAS domain S-box-containing protein
MKFGSDCEGCEHVTHLADVLKNSRDVLYKFNFETTKYDYISYSIEKLTGLNFEDVKQRGFSSLLEIIHPDDQDKIMDLYIGLLDCTIEGSELTIEYRTKNKANGNYIWRSDNIKLIRDENNQIKSIVGNVRDITDFKKHHESLHDSQEKIKAVFESSDDCIIVWDREYNYLYANQVAIDHVGTTRDKVIGKNIRDGLAHIPDFMNLWMKRVDMVFETCKSMRVEDADYIGDKLVYSQSVLSPIKNSSGEIFAVSVVYRDITDKMELHKKVEEMAENYKNLYNNALIPLYRTRLSDGKLIECNKKMVELLGYESKEECLREHYSAKNYADPEQRDKLISLLNENGKVDEFVLQTHKVDGSLLWVKVSAKLNSEGTHIDGAMQDVTASKILTEAELMVLRLVLQGKTNKDIAEELKRSVRTIEDHRSHIMHRMGVNNLVELAKEAVKLGLGSILLMI